LTEFCCEKFKEECENFDEWNHQDGIGKSKYGGKYFFWFEGCCASFELIYCPNCGKKIVGGAEASNHSD
jgi:hypothetical protein